MLAWESYQKVILILPVYASLRKLTKGEGNPENHCSGCNCITDNSMKSKFVTAFSVAEIDFDMYMYMYLVKVKLLIKT